MSEDIYKQIIEQSINQNLKDIDSVLKLRRKICKTNKSKVFPSIIQILTYCNEQQLKLLKFLITKPTRTISGVTPVAIMTSPEKCPHGKCIMCPGGINSFFGNTPQSYTGKEPATMRAIRNFYDPYLQVFNRLEQYVLLNQSIDKIELIIMGGTFPARNREYRDSFITYSLKAMNDFSELFFKNELDFEKFKKFFELPNNKDRTESIQKKILELKQTSTLEIEQKRNETTKARCVAMCVETRPDYGKLKDGMEMLKLGCTRIELGVQSVYDDVLKKIERGHTVDDTKESIRTLKDLGFKISIHYMPGLPGVNRKRDLEGLKLLFEDNDFKPDMLKIYPCVVTKGTKIYDMWRKNEFKVLDVKNAAEMIAELKKVIPEYCRIQRIQRDISTKVIEAGVNMSNLRQYIHDNYKTDCKCIRCREVKNKKAEFKKIKVREYNASNGKEFFISAVDEKNEILFGYCRLRFPSECLRKEITKDTGLIRELHVYSSALDIDKNSNDSYQHRGIGKELMKRAEEICEKYNKKKIVVISGIGAREYFKRIGYRREGCYMVKGI